MYIFAKFKNKNAILNIDENDTILEIKIQIRSKLKIPVKHQKLLIDKIILENNNTVGYYGIIQSTILTILDLRKPLINRNKIKNIVLNLTNKIKNILRKNPKVEKKPAISVKQPLYKYQDNDAIFV